MTKEETRRYMQSYTKTAGAVPPVASKIASLGKALSSAKAAVKTPQFLSGLAIGAGGGAAFASGSAEAQRQQNSPMNKAKQHAKQYAGEAKQYAGEAKQHAKQYAGEAKAFIDKNPSRALAIGGGATLLAGLFVRALRKKGQESGE